MTDGKFAMIMIGPLMNYRLKSLIFATPPDILKNDLVIFTDRFSYDLYADYHDKFNFVILDDIRKNFPISLEYEKTLDIEDEAEYSVELFNFYSMEQKRLFPFDIHRFILLYFIEQNILNFVIICSESILTEDPFISKQYFKNIPPKTVYGQWFGDDVNMETRCGFFKKNFNNIYPEFNFHPNQKFINMDGWVKGFHFGSKEDGMLFFNMWNKSIEALLTQTNIYSLGIVASKIMFCADFVTYYLMQYFTQIGYSFNDFYKFLYINNTRVYSHMSKPEERLYVMNKLGIPFYWEPLNFDIKDARYIRDFVFKNKRALNDFYKTRIPYYEITDEHVYLKLKKPI